MKAIIIDLGFRLLGFISSNIVCSYRYFAKVFLKTKDNESSSTNKSLVIGFGQEAKYLTKLKGYDYDYVYVANLDSRRMNISSARNYLFNVKRIILVTCIEEPVCSLVDCLRLTSIINKVMVTCVKPLQNEKLKGVVRNRAVRRLEKYGHKVDYLSRAYDISMMERLRNTGLISMLIAAYYSDEVDCIGFNFYADNNGEGSLTNAYGVKHAEELKQVSEELWNLFYKLLEYWHNKDFTLYTSSHLKNKIKPARNLKIVVID